MDDDMEDEIIHEVFFAHFHMFWKYVSLTSSNLSDIFWHLPASSMKTNMLKSLPLLIVIVVIILSTLILQLKREWFFRAISKCHNLLQSNVTDCLLRDFVSASIGSDDIMQDFKEGIAGVCALQGRRHVMEDRFSIHQNMDVGDGKNISLFGVFDGHGGQFAAEFVKQNLYLSVFEKIKELRKKKFIKTESTETLKTQKTTTKPKPKRSNSNEKPQLKNEENKETLQKESETSSAEMSETASDDKTQSRSELQEDDTEVDKEKTEVEKTELQGNCKTEDIKKEGENAKSENSCPDSGQVSLSKPMKDDIYSSSSLRKRNSKSSFKEVCSKKENIVKAPAQESPQYLDVNSNINYSKLLIDQMLEIDSKVISVSKSRTDFSGTTAVVAILDGELLIVCNVGDSRAVMGDHNGNAIPLSFDHKPNQLKESRRIKEAGGFIAFTGVWRVAGILATSRALGDFPLKEPRKLITAEPDVLTFSLKEHKAHFVVLASDGLWDVMSNEEVVAYIKDHLKERDHGARSLVEYAYDKGSQDNITVIVLNFSEQFV